MRSTPRLVAATVAVVAAAVLAPLSDDDAAAAPGGRAAPDHFRAIPAQVFEVPGVGTVAVGARTTRRVLVQHYDDATDTWSEPETLFEKPGVTCGDLSGRASAGGVALLLLCDRPYYEDEAPVHSQALVSQDLETWDREQLPGEAYQAPAISPDGSQAAWLTGGHGEYVRWSATDGFLPSADTGYDYDSGGETLTVDDAGTVDVIGPGPVRIDGDARCVVEVHERTAAGATRSYHLPPAGDPGGIDPGCTEGALVDSDATTVLGDPYAGGESHYVVGRASTDDDWSLEQGRAEDAPGLERYPGGLRHTIGAIFLSPPGKPVVAVGSPDRQHVTVQAFDAEAYRWSEPVEVYDHGFPGCTAQGDLASYGAYVLDLHCYPQERADDSYPPFSTNGSLPVHRVVDLVSADGVDWRTPVRGPRVLGVSDAGEDLVSDLVAVPEEGRTTLVSPDAVDTIGGSTGTAANDRCDVVHPVPDPGNASGLGTVRIHASRGAAWPDVLQQWDGGHWTVIQRDLPLPARGTCRKVFSDTLETATRYYLNSAGLQQQVAVRIKPDGDSWRVVRAKRY